MLPKYALLEIERKFLVHPARLPELSDHTGTLIEDRYLSNTRLRLRCMKPTEGEAVYKLCKKYGVVQPGSEPIVNIYLSLEEYSVLANLPGRVLRKRRYSIAVGGDAFGVDVFEGDLEGLILAEIEASSLEAAAAVVAPPWCIREVTAEPFFFGERLSRTTAAELSVMLATLGPTFPGS